MEIDEFHCVAGSKMVENSHHRIMQSNIFLRLIALAEDEKKTQ